MAAANMNGLRGVYGYDVISKVKGCEFHYSQSVEKHSKKFQEHDINMFKVLANKLLTSETREAYNAAFDDISKFILKQQDLKAWLSWWHERRHIIFRELKSGNAPRSNLAEVIHSGWKNRCEVGLSLLESTEFDVRDSFILKAQLGQLAEKEQGFGSGPSFGELKERRNVRNVECAKRKGN